MPSKRTPKPGPGQGELFGGGREPEVVEIEDFEFLRSDLDAPATSLADYYGTLAKAVKEIARARSNSTGFPQLSDNSAPVKEYSYRFDADADQTKQIISRAGSKHLMKAQDALFRRNEAEFKAMLDYAHASGEVTVEYVYENSEVAPSVHQLEFKYFTDPASTAKELAAKRRALYHRAEHYGQDQPHQVA